MLDIRRQSRVLWIVLIGTIAWQAFVYGWVVNTSAHRAVWPLRGQGVQIASAWQKDAVAPLTTIWRRWLAAVALRTASPERVEARLNALLAWLAHLLWVSTAVALAALHASEPVSGVWAYLLTVWNPMAMVAVVRHRWDFLLAQVGFSLAVYLWMRRARWLSVWMYWLALLFHPHVLFFFPWMLYTWWRIRGTYRRWLAIVPGIGLLVLAIVGTRGVGWIYGLRVWWWGSERWPDIGWNALTFLQLTPIAERWAGGVSLALWMAVVGGVTYLYSRNAMRMRTWVMWLALAAWLVFWRSHFLEMGLALYWIGVYIAHDARLYRLPLCTAPESREGEF